MQDIFEQQRDPSQQDNNSDSDYRPGEADESDSSCDLSLGSHELPAGGKFHKWRVRITNWLMFVF